MSNQRRLNLSHVAVRVMGAFLTLPTPQALREIARPGNRIMVATTILKSLKTYQERYNGVLEDAVRELIEGGETWRSVAARSDLIDPLALQRKIADMRRKETRQDHYRDYGKAA